MTEDAPPDPELLSKAEEFADEVAAVLNGTIAVDAPVRAAVVGSACQVAPYTADDERTVDLPLYIREEHWLDLRVRFLCRWDFTGQFLAVKESTFAVIRARERDPLIRFHYQGDRQWAAAHIHVHAERDVVGFLLSRRKAKARTFRSLHLPVGGKRFRPSLEDVIEFIVEEFEVDTRPGWREQVEEGRLRWKNIQLRAAIRDMLRPDPEGMKAELHRLIDRAYEDVTRR